MMRDEMQARVISLLQVTFKAQIEDWLQGENQFSPPQIADALKLLLGRGAVTATAVQVLEADGINDLRVFFQNPKLLIPDLSNEEIPEVKAYMTRFLSFWLKVVETNNFDIDWALQESNQAYLRATDEYLLDLKVETAAAVVSASVMAARSSSLAAAAAAVPVPAVPAPKRVAISGAASRSNELLLQARTEKENGHFDQALKIFQQAMRYRRFEKNNRLLLEDYQQLLQFLSNLPVRTDKEREQRFAWGGIFSLAKTFNATLCDLYFQEGRTLFAETCSNYPGFMPQINLMKLRFYLNFVSYSRYLATNNIDVDEKTLLLKRTDNYLNEMLQTFAAYQATGANITRLVYLITQVTQGYQAQHRNLNEELLRIRGLLEAGLEDNDTWQSRWLKLKRLREKFYTAYENSFQELPGSLEESERILDRDESICQTKYEELAGMVKIVPEQMDTTMPVLLQCNPNDPHQRALFLNTLRQLGGGHYVRDLSGLMAENMLKMHKASAPVEKKIPPRGDNLSLHHAAHAGNNEEITGLLARSHELLFLPDPVNSLTPIEYAAMHGHAACLRTLIKNGYFIGPRAVAILERAKAIAIQHGQQECLTILFIPHINGQLTDARNFDKACQEYRIFYLRFMIKNCMKFLAMDQALLNLLKIENWCQSLPNFDENLVRRTEELTRLTQFFLACRTLREQLPKEFRDDNAFGEAETLIKNLLQKFALKCVTLLQPRQRNLSLMQQNPTELISRLFQNFVAYCEVERLDFSNIERVLKNDIAMSLLMALTAEMSKSLRFDNVSMLSWVTLARQNQAARPHSDFTLDVFITRLLDSTIAEIQDPRLSLAEVTKRILDITNLVDFLLRHLAGKEQIPINNAVLPIVIAKMDTLFNLYQQDCFKRYPTLATERNEQLNQTVSQMLQIYQLYCRSKGWHQDLGAMSKEDLLEYLTFAINFFEPLTDEAQELFTSQSQYRALNNFILEALHRLDRVEKKLQSLNVPVAANAANSGFWSRSQACNSAVPHEISKRLQNCFSNFYSDQQVDDYLRGKAGELAHRETVRGKNKSWF